MNFYGCDAERHIYRSTQSVERGFENYQRSNGGNNPMKNIILCIATSLFFLSATTALAGPE
ncbi:MAG: hypothetical protein KDH84_16065, partial [Calditrichaeota bacterium]|nr:hypothetical protein [Calditrichota bacterium]